MRKDHSPAAAFARILGLLLPAAAVLSLLLSFLDLAQLVSGTVDSSAQDLMERITSPAGPGFDDTGGNRLSVWAMAMLLAVPLLGYGALAIYYLRRSMRGWASLTAAQALLLFILAVAVLVGW